MALSLQIRSIGIAALVALSSTSAPAGSADTVLQWNEIALQSVASANPFIQSRSMAISQLAVLLAATKATNEAATAEVGETASPVSPEAAVMAASHEALRALHPDSAPTLDAALARGLSAILEGDAKANGISIGRRAATSILEQQSGDGWNAEPNHTPGNGAGVWVPTPPKFAVALVPHWGKLTPFVLKSGNQFRPGAPSPIDSEANLKDLREVFDVGSQASSLRSAELTDVAHFWVASAVQGWNPAARQVSIASGHGLLDNARTFALLNAAIADGLIACFDAKYAYNSWRPVTAIQAGVGEIGPATEWLPLIPTPPFPAYPSAHACAAGAASAVLERTFGSDGHKIVLTSATAPGVEFSYASFAAIADQIDNARVYGGIHTREDQAVGRALGAKVGQFVFEKFGKAGQ